MKREVTLPVKFLVPAVVILLLIFGGVGYKLYSDRAASANNPQNEVAKLVEAVSKITDLPAEAPTVATVTDKEKLKQYPFFQKAEIGDKVLLYNTAKKAYLYRPSTSKLIEVGPITVAQNAEASSSATMVAGEATESAKTEKYSVALLNGTKTAGLASKAELQLTAANIKNIEVKTKSNAKNDYPKTIVVAAKSETKPLAAEIAKTFNAKVENLPEGESKPNTDIVVFLGEDRI